MSQQTGTAYPIAGNYPQEINVKELNATKIIAGTITADKLSAAYIVVGGAAADINAGVTTISGGKITANSIDASAIKTSTLVVALTLGVGGSISVAAGAVLLDADGIALKGAGYLLLKHADGTLVGYLGASDVNTVKLQSNASKDILVGAARNAIVSGIDISLHASDELFMYGTTAIYLNPNSTTAIIYIGGLCVDMSVLDYMRPPQRANAIGLPQTVGVLYYDLTWNHFVYWDGTAWKSISHS